MTVPLSILELVAVESGRGAADALAAAGRLVSRADELDYRRVWFAEHHDSDLGASVVPAVLIAHFAARTTRIRLGSGGVLAPNHAPLALAEQFAALALLNPGRVDLGLGRGPGTHNQDAVRALRRGATESYPDEVESVLRHLSGGTDVKPVAGWDPADAPEPWLLASSPDGAALAGRLGLPIALAHHIRPDGTEAAVHAYRESFVASRWSSRPYVMLSVAALVADTDTEAAELVRPLELTMAAVLSGDHRPSMPNPAQAAAATIPPELRPRLAGFFEAQAIGSVATVAGRFKSLTDRYGADELMLVSSVYDPDARIRSLELAAEAAS